MKKSFVFTLSSMAIISSYLPAQTGKVTYEERIKLNIQVDDGPGASMLDSIQLPREQKSTKVLYFTNEASFYNLEEPTQKQDEITKEHGENRMVIRMDRPQHQVHYDLKNNQLTEMREFLSRKFLITSSPDKSEWKLTGNQKKILDYPCMEAVKQIKGQKITAWFTPAIPVSTGPSGSVGLPGLVLAVSVDDNQQTLMATSVELKEIDNTIIVKPKEGKKITKGEFNKIVEEKMKEMQEENGGNGNVIIKIKKD